MDVSWCNVWFEITYLVRRAHVFSEWPITLLKHCAYTIIKLLVWLQMYCHEVHQSGGRYIATKSISLVVNVLPWSPSVWWQMCCHEWLQMYCHEVSQLNVLLRWQVIFAVCSKMKQAVSEVMQFYNSSEGDVSNSNSLVRSLPCFRILHNLLKSVAAFRGWVSAFRHLCEEIKLGSVASNRGTL